MTLRLSSCRYLLKKKPEDLLLGPRTICWRMLMQPGKVLKVPRAQHVRSCSKHYGNCPWSKHNWKQLKVIKWIIHCHPATILCAWLCEIWWLYVHIIIYIYDNTYRYIQRYICTPLQSYISYIRIWSLFFMESRKQATPQVVVIFSQVKSLWLQAQVFGRRQ